MFKLLGGVLLGVFLGGLIIEVVKRRRPELIEGVERQAKEAMDRLFENLRETYDFREASQDAKGPPREA